MLDFLLFGTAFLIKAFSGKVQFKACSFIAVALAISITAVFGSFENSSVYVRVLSGDESCAVMVYNNKSAVVYGLREYDQYYKAQKSQANTILILNVFWKVTPKPHSPLQTGIIARL